MPGEPISEQAVLWLALVYGPAAVTPPSIADPQAALAKLWSRREEAFFWRQARTLADLKRRARRQLEQLQRLGAQAIFSWEPSYPQALHALPQPPAVIFLRGALAPGRWVALVGSRAASRAGVELARDLAGQLVRAGVGVISGGALGIDAAAHQGALAAAGPTAAVLGSGLDRLYPERNRQLLEQIASCGALLSPFALGQRPLAHHFLQRNALIAALAEAVVVIEAQQRSGALSTAAWALRLGLPLATAGLGPGACALRGRNAPQVKSGEDILNILDGRPPAPGAGVELDAEQSQAWELLRQGPLSVDELAARLAWRPGQAASALLRLELEGLARALPGGRFEAIGGDVPRAMDYPSRDAAPAAQRSSEDS